MTMITLPKGCGAWASRWRWPLPRSWSTSWHHERWHSKSWGWRLPQAPSGWPASRRIGKGLAALRHGRLNINALMSVAVTGAFLIGQWPEAAMVMALYAIAELIEARAVDRARNAIKSLLDLTPDTAEVRQADGDWLEVPARGSPCDAVVRVKPGARIPLDGVVTAGTSAVNQAPVTGESIPVDKAVGDAVFAGTINDTGTLELRVTAAASNTTLARIIHAVEQAQGARAPTQQFVDRFAAIYTPAVFAMAVAVAVLTPWLMDLTWTAGAVQGPGAAGDRLSLRLGDRHAGHGRQRAGGCRATRHPDQGRRLPGGGAQAQGHRARQDRHHHRGQAQTGGDRDPAARRSQESQVLRWAGDLAGHSDHPVVQGHCAGSGQGQWHAAGIHRLAGRGVQARVDGQTLVLGNHRLIEERGPVQRRRSRRGWRCTRRRAHGHDAGVGDAGAGDLCGGRHHQGEFARGAGRAARARRDRR